MNDLMKPDMAAAYLRVEPDYLMRQCRGGTGPVYLMPSPRKILFRKVDLDAWRNSWVERGQKTN
jgi:hypothetical protein